MPPGGDPAFLIFGSFDQAKERTRKNKATAQNPNFNITNEGETVEEGAIREAKEELGYELRGVKKVYEAYLSPGADIELAHFFVAEYYPNMKVGKGGGLEEESEDVTAVEIDFTEAKTQLQQGEFKDAKTIVLLQYFFMNEAELVG